MKKIAPLDTKTSRQALESIQQVCYHLCKYWRKSRRSIWEQVFKPSSQQIKFAVIFAILKKIAPLDLRTSPRVKQIKFVVIFARLKKIASFKIQKIMSFKIRKIEQAFNPLESKFNPQKRRILEIVLLLIQINKIKFIYNFLS